MTGDGKTPAWLVVWSCGCHDVQTARADLPEKCPGHGKRRIQEAEQLDVLDRYLGVHECGQVACGGAR